jgi:predicted metal-dependent phosphoesterase TrpH
MVSRINEAGIPLSVDDVFAIANCRSPGRPHVARALVAGEFCSNLDEAFERFLKKGRPAWAPKFKISAAEAIALIHQAGGLAVMAHPGLTRADELIPTLAQMGLDGLECYHTKHTNAVAGQYRAQAERLQLLITGGSDCHGTTKGKPLIGSVKLPYEHVERMKTRVAERAAERGFHLAGSSTGNPVRL